MTEKRKYKAHKHKIHKIVQQQESVHRYYCHHFINKRKQKQLLIKTTMM
jgi:hypothetical protein